MKIAFYKAFQRKSTKLDILIAIVTLGKYSHVEWVFSDGMCFSSSYRDKGTRFKKINLDPAQWKMYNVICSRQQELKLRAFCEGHEKVGYDAIGAIFSAIPFLVIQRTSKYFCSELVVNSGNMILGFGLQDGAKYSPNRLERIIKKRSTPKWQ